MRKAISLKTIFLICFIFAFKLLYAADYYWVGGTGNWSDLSHWATTSGGNIYHAQSPTPFDNVIFDANSFTAHNQVVTINLANTTCKNMTWINATANFNNPTLAGENVNQLKIYGSLTFISGMNFTFSGNTYFEATTAGNTIKMDGKQFNSSIHFQGVGGSWSLLDALNVGGDINVYNGVFQTNGNNISCSSFNSNITNIRTINLGSSNITTSVWNVSSTGLTLNAASCIITCSSSFSAGSSLIYNEVIMNGGGFSGGSQFQKVVFNSSATISGNQTFNNMKLTAGKVYNFSASSNQTILTNLEANGTCSSPITMKSTTIGTPATFTKTSGNLNIDYVVLADMNATGGAVFTAYNSVNLRNNTGWNIIAAAPKNLFWIGGSGNWDNPAHWAYSSGGTGPACVPSPFDNVFFDANSFTANFQSVNINPEIATCYNMDWSGSEIFKPVVNGGSTLQIYGSLKLTTPMSWNFSGTTYFEAITTGHSITSATNIFKNDVYFTGIGGGWQLLDNFDVGNSRTIHFNSGTLNTNSYKINCKEFTSSGGYPRSLTLGSSVVTVDYSWNVNSTNFVFNSGTSLIKLVTSNANMYSGDNLVYYNVLFENNLGSASLSGDNNVYHKVEFVSNASITGNNTYDSLVVASGKKYVLTAGKTQTIIKELLAIGTCSKNIYFESSLLGSVTSIRKTSGIVNVYYIVLRDVRAIGGAIFNAYASVNLGGDTSGWIILPPLSRNLYWVGGSGYWNDETHWSLNSNGTGGGECIPTPLDNVFFNEFSFTAPNQTVDMIVGEASCKNMDWSAVTNNPKIFNYVNLNIFGSLILAPEMIFDITGYLYFKSTNLGNIVKTENQLIKSYCRFDGIGGGWSLSDDFHVGTFFLINGNLNFNSFDVECDRFESNVMTQRTLNMAGSTINVKMASMGAWSIYGLNMNVNATNSEVNILGINGGFRLYGGSGFVFNNVNFNAITGTAMLNTSQTTATFSTVNFLSSAKIYGQNTFNILNFTANGKYSFENNKTQTIISEWNTRGNNCFPVTLSSFEDGIQTKIFKATGTVWADFTLISDIYAFGGADFLANADANDGNNFGWEFNDDAGFIYGLGNDTILPYGETMRIETDNFNGTPLTTYHWFNETNNTFLDLTEPAKVWVTAFYSSECSKTDTLNVYFLKTTQPLCSGDSNGEIEVLYPPVGNYSFEWTTAATTPLITNLYEGTYGVTVTDNYNGRQVITNSSIEQPTPLEISVVSNNGCTVMNNGTIEINAEGGTGNYMYAINGDVYTVTNVFNNLSAGVYEINVTDQNSCTINTTVEIIEPQPIVLNSVSTMNSCGSGGQIIVNASGGSVPLLFSIDGTNFQQSNEFLNLPSGNYTVYITDSGNCMTVTSTVQTIVVSPEIVVNEVNTTNTCDLQANGTITINAQGGIGTLKYSIDGSNYQTLNTFTNVEQGNYTCFIQDETLCEVSTSTTINANEAPHVDLGADLTIVEGETKNVGL